MKRIISITIILCLVFCSVLPVYAEAWTAQQASSVTQAVTGILSSIVNNGIGFTEWATLLGNGNAPAYYHSFQDLYNRIDWALSWIVPDTLHGQTDPTIMDSLIVLTNYAMNHLPQISVIANYVAGWMNNNITWQSRIGNALGNMSLWDTWNQTVNAHYALFDKNLDPDAYASWGADWYHFNWINDNGGYHINAIGWNQGSPLGNIARELQILNDNVVDSYRYRWAADLTHYNDNLTTWDSQGSTLTQVAFTPQSAIQGLYRYLAFTQRDVARLAYVFANDEELEARELAQANQEQVMDDFIDPTGSGSASPSDIGSISDLSSGYKNNFGSDAQVTGIFNIFNSNNMGWFSQETKNQLDTTSRSRSESNTPLLDKQIQDIYQAIGVEPDESR